MLGHKKISGKSLVYLSGESLTESGLGGGLVRSVGRWGKSGKKLDNTVLSFNLGLSEFITNEAALAVRQELNIADASSDQANSSLDDGPFVYSIPRFLGHSSAV